MNSQKMKTLLPLEPLHNNVLYYFHTKNIYNMESLLKNKPSEIKAVCFVHKDPLAWIRIIDMARECGKHLSDEDSWVDYENARRLSKAELRGIITPDQQYYRVVQILNNNWIRTLGDLIELPPSFIYRIEYISNRRFDIIENILNWFGYHIDRDADMWRMTSPFSKLTPEEMNDAANGLFKTSPETYRALKQTGYLTKETIDRVERNVDDK